MICPDEQTENADWPKARYRNRRRNVSVGVTGTRNGATPAQLDSLNMLWDHYREWSELHHGDCYGVDVQVAAMALGRGKKVFSHPASDTEQWRAHFPYAEKTYEPIPALDRNRIIVSKSQVLLVVPDDRTPKTRSGTWATQRYAKKCKSRYIIVWPNGDVEHHNFTIDDY